MRPFRRSPLLAGLLAVLAVAPPALAQEPEGPSVELRLLRQTAWTTPEEPLLRIALRVTNLSDVPVSEPVVGWVLGPEVNARLEYEAALEDGPSFAATSDTVPFGADLDPGTSTDVPIAIDTRETGGIAADDSAVYPLQLQLRSDDQVIAAITTAAIHIVRPPLRKVPFSWWTEIASPVAFGPDGTLIDPGFEDELAGGGSLVAQVNAIAALLAGSQPAAIDLIVSPAALDQLSQAADGYERRTGGTAGPEDPAALAATATLDRLRTIGEDPRARLHAMPFAAPRLPALLSAGLRSHLDTHWSLGDETFERVLGEGPDVTVARPPGLVIDQASVDLLEARGATTILGAADSVPRPPQEQEFAPPGAATVRTTGGREVDLLLPDPGTQALLEDEELMEDPVRAAQVILGELATIWREEPVPPDDEERGLALDLAPGLPAAFWAPAIRRLALAPFLQPTHAADLAGVIRPEPGSARLSSTALTGFTPEYADELDEADRRLAAFAAILEEPTEEVGRLRRALLYAEASQYVGNEGSGRAWIGSVNDVIDRTFSALAPNTSRILTFTSRSGNIPLQMGDPGDRVVTVNVALASGRLEFTGDSTRTVRLDEPNEVITFEFEFKATGPSPVEVLLTAPNGMVLSRHRLIVRSTAINPIALLITIGAGVILLGSWARRMFRRRSP